MKIRTRPMLDLTIMRYQNLTKVLDFNPAYQREGGVWSQETRSRLMDSIVNGLDMPKIYFQTENTKRKSGGRTIQYAVLDGKQRLETINEFLVGDLALPEDFEFYEDEQVDARGMDLPTLLESHPVLAQRVFDYQLPVIRVDSDSTDLVEEMFQRLNASTALNNAERRNAISGHTRDAVNRLAEHRLLAELSPIKSSRYKYRELAAKFLAIEHQMARHTRVVDTKASTLLDLFLVTHGDSPQLPKADIAIFEKSTIETLDRMVGTFEENDSLLASIGTMVVYYIAARSTDVATSMTRPRLEKFEALRRTASRMSEEDPEYARRANIRLREYNVLVQSTNDGRALSRRAEIVSRFVKEYAESDALKALDAVSDAQDPSREEADGG